MRNLVALFAVSCGSSAARVADPIAPAAPTVVATVIMTPRVPANVAASAPAPTPDPPFMRGIRSVVLLKNVAVHKQPRFDSAVVGIVRKGTRSAVAQAIAAGVECSTGDGADGRWLELEPRGWTCESATEPSTLAPTEAAPVDLADD